MWVFWLPFFGGQTLEKKLGGQFAFHRLGE
jgi:hypothetical protein